MIHYACPGCKTALESKDNLAGKTDICPACNAECKVPLPNIKYKCPGCSTRLESPGEMGGREDVCPKCHTKCSVPQLPHQKAAAEERRRKDEAEAAAAKRFQEEQRVAREVKQREASLKNVGVDVVSEATDRTDDGLKPQTKRCPICAETIQAKAIKCRYCGEMLQKSPVAVQEILKQPLTGGPIPAQRPSGEQIFNLLKLVPGLLGSVLFLVIVLMCAGVFNKGRSASNEKDQNIEAVAVACVALSESKWQILQGWDSTYCLYSINNNLREINAGEKVSAPPDHDWSKIWEEVINPMHLPVGTTYSDIEAELLHKGFIKAQARRN